MEQVLWHQLQTANEQIAFLQEKLGNVLDHQFFDPVVAPRTDLETTNGNAEFNSMLSESAEFDEKADEKHAMANNKALEDANKTLADELAEGFEEIAREQAEAHAETA